MQKSAEEVGAEDVLKRCIGGEEMLKRQRCSRGVEGRGQRC